MCQTQNLPQVSPPNFEAFLDLVLIHIRYVVRKKQGGTQSSRDKCGNAPRSVGATIRRENETKFKEVTKTP